MSIGFNWFKNYKIIKEEYRIGEIEYKIQYLDGDSTSFSAGNIEKVDTLLEEYGDIQLPRVWDEYSLPIKNIEGLINPKRLSEVCKTILNDTKVDKVDMRERIEWMKEKADQGYYMTYDYD